MLCLLKDVIKFSPKYVCLPLNMSTKYPKPLVLIPPLEVVHNTSLLCNFLHCYALQYTVLWCTEMNITMCKVI